MPCVVGTTDLRRLAILAVALIAGCGAPLASGPVASGPPASPRISCLGIPSARCDEAVASVARSLPNSAPVSIEVSCVAGTCTPESGAMDTVVTLADGSQLRSTTISWANSGGQLPGGVKPLPAPVPALVLPVEPQCQSVPAAMCKRMAEASLGTVGDLVVVQIVVRCSAPSCTDSQGEGDTLVTYADGTTSTSGWGYAGG